MMAYAPYLDHLAQAVKCLLIGSRKEFGQDKRRARRLSDKRNIELAIAFLAEDGDLELEIQVVHYTLSNLFECEESQASKEGLASCSCWEGEVKNQAGSAKERS